MKSSMFPGAAPGFTLIELMVALLLSMLLAIGLIKTQSKFGQQTVRNSDIRTRDAQVRAAMDLITQDLSGAGFLFGGTQNFCNALLTYNSAGSYYVHRPVGGLAAAAGAVAPFAPSLTLNYPVTASTVTSDVLVTTTTTASTNFNDQVYPVVIVSPNPAYTPMTTGVLQTAASLRAAATGDVGILQLPVSGKRACVRVPLAVVGQVVTSAAGALMPTSYYTGFSGQLAAAGFNDILSNAEIYEGRMVDMGATTAPLQTTVAYYVDGSGAFPMLMRATYSLLDDSLIGTPQSIAAGVVSLSVLFGVDPANSGAISAYETAATVTANKHWDAVLSVKVALVTRTINDDPDSSFVGPTVVSIGAPFPDLTVPASNHRYVVQQTEIANRNLLWK